METKDEEKIDDLINKIVAKRIEENYAGYINNIICNDECEIAVIKFLQGINSKQEIHPQAFVTFISYAFRQLVLDKKIRITVYKGDEEKGTAMENDLLLDSDGWCLDNNPDFEPMKNRNKYISIDFDVTMD